MTAKFLEFLNLFIGLRKTIAWFSLMAVAIWFRLKGYVNGQEFTDLAKNTFLGFVAGNMTEHLATTVKDYVNSKGQKVEEVDTNVEEEK